MTVSGGEKPEEETLARAERLLTRYEAALAATGDAVWEWDVEHDEHWWSRRCYELLEHDPSVEPSFEAFRARVHPEDFPALSRLIEANLASSELTFGHEYRLALPGERVVIVTARGFVLRDPSGAPRRLVGVLRDVTTERRLEEQLLQSQKMESIGRLAGGVAHDFNNLLTVILVSARFVERRLPPGSPAQDDLQNVCQAADRASRLTAQLLAFARRQVVEPTLIDLNELTGRMHELLRRIIGEHIELVTILAPDLGAVRADVAQMEQVLLNLAVNARDAMPRGGKLTLETADVTLGEPYVRSHVNVVEGPYVMLAVSDNGTGITPEARGHIFEPFFTTKEQGTGLGLATCYGIVRQADGHIVVYSEPGRGTTFKILLPRASAEAEVEQRSPDSEPVRGVETVLFVEDDESVRRVGTRVLVEHGYRVLEAADGWEALRVAEAHAGPIPLLVTDVVMPRMSGPELAARLRDLRPGLEVLFTSGYTANAIVHHGVLDPQVDFLQKPYTEESLLAKVRSTLDATLRTAPR